MRAGRRAPSGDRRRAGAVRLALLALILAACTLTAGTAVAADPTDSPTSTATGSPTSTATATTTAPSSTTTTTRSGGGNGGGQVGSGSTPTPSGPAPVYTLQIALTSMTPSVVTPTSTLTIKGTITNTGTTLVQNAEIRLLVHHSPLITRALVQEWGAGQILDVGGRILDAQADLPVDLPAGGTVPFTITAPADRLGLSMAYASIGTTLEALGDDGSIYGTHRLGLLRTYLTWQAKAAYTPLKLSWLFPLSGGPTSTTGGRPSSQQLATALAPGGALQNLLTAVRAAPAGAPVTLAIDPALLADLRADQATTNAGPTSGAGSGVAPASPPNPTTGSGGSPAAPTAGQTVSAYLAALKTALAGHRVLQLPYGDPDLAALGDDKGGTLLSAATAAAGSADTGLIHQILGVTPTTGVAWPSGGYADGATLTALRKAQYSSVVLSAGSRPPTPGGDADVTTPSGLASLSGGGSALLYDDTLSGLLGRTANPAQTVLTVQRFLAESLAAVTERPFRSRIVLVAAPRGFDPDPAAVGTLFAAVKAAPWIAGASLSQLRSGQGQDEVDDRTAVATPASVRKAQLRASQVSDTLAVRAQAQELSEVIPGDASLPVAATDALRLVSSALRKHPSNASSQVKALHSRLVAEGSQIRILKTSTLNFFASNGFLPLSVANNLPHTVQGLRIVVRAETQQLVVRRQPAPLTIDAQRRATIRVQMHAVASGLVPVTVRVETPSGLTLGSPVTVHVRVRPTDSWAFWAIGVVAGLVLLIGIVRTFRRGRRQPPVVEAGQ